MSEPVLPPAEFVAHVAKVIDAIGDELPGPALEDRLNRDFPAMGEWFAAAAELCGRGTHEGWLCGREAGGIRFGRALKPCEATRGMSIDVVEMDSVVGPHHSHPNGEIDLVMPIDPEARFDGQGAGWKVYGPASAHNPTVTGGRALVLYLLPGGAIEFTRV